MPLANSNLSKDMIGREFLLPNSPQRIISLVPSLTELLSSLNLEDRVVGISNYCVHPKDWQVNKAKIGGTKKVNIRLISQLNPDLIIANKEENNREDITILSAKYPVWVSQINSFDDALLAIEWLGEITQSEKYSKRLIFAIHKAWSEFKIGDYTPLSCAYLIWDKPIMAVGRNTFINDILIKNNLMNVIEEDRYPKINLQLLEKKKPDVILLSSEPYHFKEEDRLKMENIFPESIVLLVDGEMFSWYGFRMKLAATYFKKIVSEIHNKKI